MQTHTTPPSFLSRLWTSVMTTLRRYLNLDSDKVEDTEAVTSIVSGVEFRGSNLWILVCAVFIASLGLNMNSTAVIIGAMLISPLMGPIMGIGLGVGINDGELMRRSAKNLFVATLFALLTSCFYFLLSPINDARSELLARTQPTIYDVLIAFFGGFAGIIATGSRSKGNILPGVAIATALMPPLCTAGYGLATMQWQFFFGAFYLFLINCVYIGVATWLGVRILQLPKLPVPPNSRQRHIRQWTSFALVMVMIPSIFTTWDIVRTNVRDARIQAYVNAEFSHIPDVQLVDYCLVESDSVRTIEVSLIGTPLSEHQIALISAKMGSYHIEENTQLKVMQGTGRIDEAQLSSTIMQGVVRMSQDQLARQQQLTDSLREVIQFYEAQRHEADELVPVLRALFPQVLYISISHAPVTSVVSGESVASTIVIAYVAQDLDLETREKLRAWLAARKGTQAFHLIVRDVVEMVEEDAELTSEQPADSLDVNAEARL